MLFPADQTVSIQVQNSSLPVIYVTIKTFVSSIFWLVNVKKNIGLYVLFFSIVVLKTPLITKSINP